MKQLGLLAFLVCAAVLAAPAATAQEDPAAGFLGASLDKVTELPLRDLTESNALPAGRTALVDCGAGHISLDTQGKMFIFTEGQLETGCSEARLELRMDEGVKSVRVDFWANREISNPAGTDLPRNLPQEFRVYSGDNLQFINRYFEPTSASVPTKQFFSFETPVQNGSTTVAWWFEDSGPNTVQTTGPVFGHSFQAAVQNATIWYQGIPAATRVSSSSGSSDANERQRILDVEWDFADADPRASTELVLRVDNWLGISTIRAPNGDVVPSDLLSASEESGILSLRLTSAVLEQYGAGTYSVRFVGSSPIKTNFAMVPFALATVLGAVATGGSAVRRVHRTRAETTSGQNLIARGIERVVFAAAGSTLVLILGLIVTGRAQMMALWPINAEGILYYMLFIVLIFVFLVTGLRATSLLQFEFRRQAEKEANLRRAVERSNLELEQYAYVASHDLQEPLRVVGGHVQLIKARYNDLLDDEGRQYIEFTVDGVKRMKEMLQALLQLSRINSSEEPHVMVAPKQLVDEAVAGLEALIMDTGATVKVGSLPKVRANASQLRQVFQNLVSNALKFHGEAPPVISISGKRVQNMVRFEVRDNGIGIEDKNQARVFQMFQRLHPRTEYAGSGIGLALCARIVACHGGEIWFDSEIGRGTTFYFTLPSEPTG